jgi:predicted  nucleic acid-binding Zn-ribbon protein
MKIILTEKQLELLKLITENQDVIANFKNSISNINNLLNKLYTDINFISLAELLNGEIDIKAFNSRIDNIESEYDKLGASMEKYFNSFDEDEYFYHDKINIISSILMDLDSLISDNEDTKDVFSDIKSINLS